MVAWTALVNTMNSVNTNAILAYTVARLQDCTLCEFRTLLEALIYHRVIFMFSVNSILIWHLMDHGKYTAFKIVS